MVRRLQPARPDKPSRIMRGQNGRSVIWGKYPLQSLQQMSRGMSFGPILEPLPEPLLGSTRSARRCEAKPIETIGVLG
jgi:hypothetical protein